MSQRLRDRFEQGRREKRALFIPYVTGGYPTAAETVDIMLQMEAGGADVIEIGVPFSDPLADGATIQHANQVAVEQGVTLHDCFGFVGEARARGLQAPVLLMGYYNPILALGEARCAIEAAAAGVDGFIVVDLPAEEAASFLAVCRQYDLSFVPLVAPTTADARIDQLAAVADAFLYIVSVTGTTGTNNMDVDQLPELLARVRRHSNLPLAVGFGISKREHVVAVGRIADAAIIGSAIISAIDAAAPGMRAQGVREFVEDVSGH
ncbi:MAG: tryptophan synthase subunit alpha [Chloroflexi bacterium]|nr:tryptophan synthase subunit alpha [Chloroflexota bacterium]